MDWQSKDFCRHKRVVDIVVPDSKRPVCDRNIILVESILPGMAHESIVCMMSILGISEHNGLHYRLITYCIGKSIESSSTKDSSPETEPWKPPELGGFRAKI